MQRRTNTPSLLSRVTSHLHKFSIRGAGGGNELPTNLSTLQKLQPKSKWDSSQHAQEGTPHHFHSLYALFYSLRWGKKKTHLVFTKAEPMRVFAGTYLIPLNHLQGYKANTALHVCPALCLSSNLRVLEAGSYSSGMCSQLNRQILLCLWLLRSLI